MPKKRKVASNARKPAPDEPPLGRPAFPDNLLPIGRDPAQPAGAVQLQVPEHQQQPKKGGAPTLTMMNPTPIAAAPTSTQRKRG